MQVIFTQKEINEAAACVKRYRFAWWLSFALYALLMLGMFVLFTVRVEVDMDRTLKIPFMVASIVITIIYFVMVGIIKDLKYRPAKARKKLFDNMQNGAKEHNDGVVIEVDKTLIQKDDVWFYSLIVECAPVRREQQNIRRLLIESNRPAPKLSEGDKINFIAHASALIAYEIKE